MVDFTENERRGAVVALRQYITHLEQKKRLGLRIAGGSLDASIRDAMTMHTKLVRAGPKFQKTKPE